MIGQCQGCNKVDNLSEYVSHGTLLRLCVDCENERYLDEDDEDEDEGA
jgi:hypothetical protein